MAQSCTWYFKEIARFRIRRFESDHPSHAVGLCAPRRASSARLLRTQRPLRLEAAILSRMRHRHERASRQRLIVPCCMISSASHASVSRLVVDRLMCLATALDKAFENIDCMSAILSCQAKNRFYESTQRLIQSRRVLCVNAHTQPHLSIASPLYAAAASAGAR